MTLAYKNSPRALARSLAQKGEACLDTEAFNLAVSEFLSALANIKYIMPKVIAEAVVRRTIRAYLRNVQALAVKSTTATPDTIALSELAIGEELERPMDYDRSVWRSRMSTARKLMNNFEARWQMMTYKGNFVISRLPDGAQPRFDPRRNIRATLLSEMKMGEVAILTDFKNRQSLSPNIKIAARRILNDSQANWTAKTTAAGLLVKRVK